jgi:hypothetical protein
MKATMIWASRSAWYDRHVGIVEAAGSNPASSTKVSLLLNPESVKPKAKYGTIKPKG